MKKLLLIDANSLIHRAFHALPPLTSKEGRPSGALYGLASILLKVMREEKPDYVAAAFDRPEPTFRKEMFGDYKATRPKAPDELVSQIVEARNLFEAFQIKSFESPGFEADDIIGTAAAKFGGEKDLTVKILTGDLDALQLVRGGKVVVEILKKGVSETATYDEAAVTERYGLTPQKLPDYKGLVGDKSDNIPGVKNIGPKTAEELIKRYGDLEGIFAASDPGDKAKAKIVPSREIAFLSRKLATIKTDVPVELSLNHLKFDGLDERSLVPYFEERGFESLIKRLRPGEKTDARENESEAEETKTLNAFFVEPGSDLGPAKFLSKNAAVAWEWKPIMKNLIKDSKPIPPNVFDITVAAWLLNPDSGSVPREEISKKYGSFSWKNLFAILERKIEKNGLADVFYRIEMPLIEVLARMELWGISIDKKAAAETRRELEGALGKAAAEIYAGAGATFNINSPKQVSEILFEKLNLKSSKGRKTKSGRFSTSSDALSKLKGMKIVDAILEYRGMSKMMSTYLDPIVNLTNEDGRLRTTFLQTGTSTGRLASEKPNLQNIPQESIWSKKIRDVFVAEDGFSLVSFDYSQLELRLLAHVSGDKNLKEAFAKNLDIHKITASQIFGVPPNLVTKEERRIGKTLNFGIVYGMGARALSETGGIGLKEAETFIKKYFERFPAIKTWQEKVKKEVAVKGFAENMNGRKRWFTESFNPMTRSENERAAVNMPIQSLEADILKTAMTRAMSFMKENGLADSRMRLLLTIHDELLFEMQDDILREIIPRISNIMEKTDGVSVPLTVEVGRGKKWGSLKKHEPEPGKIL